VNEPDYSDARALPVLVVFAESLTLAGRHSRRFLPWSAPLGVCGMALVGLAFLLDGFSPMALPACEALFLILGVGLGCAFSASIHRLLLLPGEPSGNLPVGITSPVTWRYVRGYLAVALLAVIPATLGGFLAARAAGSGIPVLDVFLPFLLPYFLSQAAIAAPQLLYLPDVSLHAGSASGGSCWRQGAAMARGYRLALIEVNLLSGVFTLGVSIFAGWVIGMIFPSGPQGVLEFLTVTAGLPAQVGTFACLQAACYRRLTLRPSA